MATRGIKKEFNFDVPVDVLWKAVAVNENLVQWLAETVTGRPKEGHSFTWTWDLGDHGVFTTNGIYKKVEVGSLLEMEWVDHPAGKITLTLEFRPLDSNRSVLVVENSGYPATADYQDWIRAAEEAWEDESDRLREFLKKKLIA